ncbi:MAG: hypothetical protein MHPSP_001929, partial [Paramarteilia canceri]
SDKWILTENSGSLKIKEVKFIDSLRILIAFEDKLSIYSLDGHEQRLLINNLFQEIESGPRDMYKRKRKLNIDVLPPNKHSVLKTRKLDNI